MYSNLYMQPYNPQVSVDKINTQIAELEKMRNQLQQPMQQPTNLTQNFQLAPNNTTMRFANSIDEVQKDFVIGDTAYFSKDMSVVWIKNNRGDIKTYELNELVLKDEKDMQIELLQAQINELKGMMSNEQHITDVNKSEVPTDTTTVDEPIRKSVEKNKSTSVQRVPTSKKK